jgi:hypothetical protein
MKSLILYTGNVGLCAILFNIIHAIYYCEQNNMKLLLCPDYCIYGDVTPFFDFGVEIIRNIPPGWAVQPHPGFVFAHPNWDYPNPTLELFNEILNMDISFEDKRRIALSFKPLVSIPDFPCETFDAVHVRRGDAFTVPQGCEYHHGSEYIANTLCDDVFVMSDDHRVLKELEGKKIHHMIPDDADGWYAVPGSITKPGEQKVFAFQNQDKKNENMTRLTQEMYIASKSQRFVHTFSNVARFIKLIHRDPSQCIDLQNTVAK